MRVAEQGGRELFLAGVAVAKMTGGGNKQWRETKQPDARQRHWCPSVENSRCHRTTSGGDEEVGEGEGEGKGKEGRGGGKRRN
jgi:hypothetical protein